MTQDVRGLTRHFKEILMGAQAERDSRPNLVTGPDGEPECAWAAYERGVMHREVNRLLNDAERWPVPLELIERVERQAVGHSDYTMKFALYCAELALGIKQPSP